MAKAATSPQKHCADPTDMSKAPHNNHDGHSDDHQAVLGNALQKRPRRLDAEKAQIQIAEHGGGRHHGRQNRELPHAEAVLHCKLAHGFSSLQHKPAG